MRVALWLLLVLRGERSLRVLQGLRAPLRVLRRRFGGVRVRVLAPCAATVELDFVYSVEESEESVLES